MPQVPVTRLGRCYDAAFELLLLHAPGFVLVHGFPRIAAGEHAGKKYGHAWLEDAESGQWCLDPERPGAVVHQAQYYEAGQIDPAECRRYPLDEAKKMAAEHGNHGPWGEQPADAIFGKRS